ncbi:hypothetical protein K438DRAFT_2023183 [Mycena galopus ATCC 62051]|nr:hypothetical protein K438DRAFT_2023183 [Mycena galopus ATCC 62051]
MANFSRWRSTDVSVARTTHPARRNLHRPAHPRACSTPIGFTSIQHVEYLKQNSQLKCSAFPRPCKKPAHLSAALQYRGACAQNTTRPLRKMQTLAMRNPDAYAPTWPAEKTRCVGRGTFSARWSVQPLCAMRTPSPPNVASPAQAGGRAVSDFYAQRHAVSWRCVCGRDRDGREVGRRLAI